MQIDEIKKKKWNIRQDLEIVGMGVDSIMIEEQECHFNISREDEKIYVDCTYQNWITKLSKSSFFSLRKLIVSRKKSKEGFILGVVGVLDIRAVTVRSTMRKFAKNEREEIGKRLNDARKRN